MEDKPRKQKKKKGEKRSRQAPSATSSTTTTTTPPTPEEQEQERQRAQLQQQLRIPTKYTLTVGEASRLAEAMAILTIATQSAAAAGESTTKKMKEEGEEKATTTEKKEVATRETAFLDLPPYVLKYIAEFLVSKYYPPDMEGYERPGRPLDEGVRDVATLRMTSRGLRDILRDVPDLWQAIDVGEIARDSAGKKGGSMPDIQLGGGAMAARGFPRVEVVAETFLQRDGVEMCLSFTARNLPPGLAVSLMLQMPKLRELALPLADDYQSVSIRRLRPTQRLKDQESRYFPDPGATDSDLEDEGELSEDEIEEKARQSLDDTPPQRLTSLRRREIQWTDLPLWYVLHLVSELQDLQKLTLLPIKGAEDGDRLSDETIAELLVGGGSKMKRKNPPSRQMNFTSLVELTCADPIVAGKVMNGTPKLRELHVTEMRADRPFQLAAALSFTPLVEVVEVDPGTLEVSGSINLTNMPNLPQLKALRLGCTALSLDDNFADSCPAIKYFESVCRLGPKQVRAISRLHNLKELQLSTVAPDEFADMPMVLGQFGDEPGAATLEYLELVNFECDPSLLFKSARCSKLESLRVQGAALPPESATAFQWVETLEKYSEDRVNDQSFARRLITEAKGLECVELTCRTNASIISILTATNTSLSKMVLWAGWDITVAAFADVNLHANFPRMSELHLTVSRTLLGRVATWGRTLYGRRIANYEYTGSGITAEAIENLTPGLETEFVAKKTDDMEKMLVIESSDPYAGPIYKLRITFYGSLHPDFFGPPKK
jgi:hypothetical protein